MARASSSESQRAGDLHLLAGHVLGAQRLAEPAFVVRDQVRGGGEDVAGAAVIALQPDDLGAGEVVVEAQDVVDLRAAPAVDRLVVIADAADVFRRGGLRRAALRSVIAGHGAKRRRRGDALHRRVMVAVHSRDRDHRDSRASGAGIAGSHVSTGESAVRGADSSSAPAAAATDTARRWCPDTRRPG